MSRRRNRANGHHPFEHTLQPPPDLLLMGFVFVRPEHATHESGPTVTVWGRPDEPQTLVEVQHQEAQGREPGALFLISTGSLVVDLQPEWRAVTWFVEYVDGLAREIQREGPERFFRAMLQRSAPVTAN